MPRRSARRHRALVAGFATLALCGCGDASRRDDPARPNVILISVDTLRADHVGCYGYPRPTTPFIDSLAAESAQFQNAFAQSSWTLPSHMSLLTSRYAHSHGVDGASRALPPGITTLAQVLRERGYATGALVSWIYVAAKFGFDRGFDRFEELLPPVEQQDSTTHYSIKAAEFVDHAIEWIGERPRRPFFLLLHLFDPHINYEPPLEHARRFDPGLADVESGRYETLEPYIKFLHEDPPPVPRQLLSRVLALYDGEIHYTDSELRRLFETFERRNMLENTLVVLTSDHGEELNDHGSMEGHQWTLYDEVLRIPLLMRFPSGEGRGKKIDTLVQSIDIAPTILAYLGVELPAGFEGVSVLPWIREDRADAANAFTFSQIRRFNNKFALRTERHKLIYTLDTGVNAAGIPVDAGFELYDLAADPGEQRNVYDPESAVVQRLQGMLGVWLTRGKPWYGGAEPPELTPEELERLRALGYLEGGAASSGERPPSR